MCQFRFVTYGAVEKIILLKIWILYKIIYIFEADLEYHLPFLGGENHFVE